MIHLPESVTEILMTKEPVMLHCSSHVLFQRPCAGRTRELNIQL